ncbi:hypothetical protein RRG08_025179 [Elysia crispata]|uniref:Interferon-induced transmembrane protein n=1 Tax=Elysia crispata TaxID=231223 RepID=A0AAE0ZB34_9GAST|nr:hypothetical protein RRG08_025179 [Elysia crispata]
MASSAYVHGEHPPPYNDKQFQGEPQPEPQMQPYGGYGYPAQPQGAGQPTVVMVAPQAQVMSGGNQVQDNMIISIVSIFFCCILGIIATIKASGSKEALKRGDIVTAQQQSTTARKLAIAAIIIGCICAGLSILSGIISAVAGASTAASSSRYD